MDLIGVRVCIGFQGLNLEGGDEKGCRGGQPVGAE